MSSRAQFISDKSLNNYSIYYSINLACSGRQISLFHLSAHARNRKLVWPGRRSPQAKHWRNWIGGSSVNKAMSKLFTVRRHETILKGNKTHLIEKGYSSVISCYITLHARTVTIICFVIVIIILEPPCFFTLCQLPKVVGPAVRFLVWVY